MFSIIQLQISYKNFYETLGHMYNCMNYIVVCVSADPSAICSHFLLITSLHVAFTRGLS